MTHVRKDFLDRACREYEKANDALAHTPRDSEQFDRVSNAREWTYQVLAGLLARHGEVHHREGIAYWVTPAGDLFRNLLRPDARPSLKRARKAEALEADDEPMPRPNWGIQTRHPARRVNQYPREER